MLTHSVMPGSKPIFAASQIQRFSEDAEERQLALEYLAEAWNAAEDDGVDSDALAHASLFAALATLVRSHGEESAAEFVAKLPERLRAGEYSLDRSVQ